MEGLIPFLFVVALVLWVWYQLRGKRAKPKPANSRGSTPTSPLLKGDGEFALSIVGLSHHSATADAIFARQIRRLVKDNADEDEPDGLEGYSETITTTVELWPVDNNPADANAVEVRIKGQVVGYLPRGLAPAFRAHVKRERLPGPSYRCKAEVNIDLGQQCVDAINLDLPKLLSR